MKFFVFFSLSAKIGNNNDNNCVASCNPIWNIDGIFPSSSLTFIVNYHFNRIPFPLYIFDCFPCNNTFPTGHSLPGEGQNVPSVYTFHRWPPREEWTDIAFYFHTKGAFLVRDNRVFNGPLGRSLCSFACTALSAHLLCSAPLRYTCFAHSLHSCARSLTLLTPMWDNWNS